MRFRDFRRTKCAGVMDFETTATWPSRVSGLLSKNLDVLRSYERRQASIDRLCEHDVLARINTPENEFRLSRDEVVAELDQALANERLLSFHCTKVLPHEKEDIRTNGLRPLTALMAAERIRQALSRGLLPESVAQVLGDDNQATDVGRANKCWFVNQRSVLADETGVSRLFRCWGGEALYVGHEPQYDSAVGNVLRTIGEPNIVVAALPACALCLHGTLGDRFANAYLARHRIRTVGHSSLETYVTKLIPADWLPDIIPITDERFEELTKSSKWSKRP